MSYDPDEMMLELFRAEVESHSDSLTNSLLRLEQDPEAIAVLDGMMRAAHSIKGAARIVRVDPAVEVAHVMEDCFVAAQRGELVLEPTGIDVLLRSVDLLVQISEASKNPKVDWSTYDATISTSVEQLRCVLEKKPIATAPTEIAAPNERQIKEATADIKTTAKDPPPKSSSVLGSLTAETPAQYLVMPRFLGQENVEKLRVELLARLGTSDAVSLDCGAMQDLDAMGLAWLHSAANHAKKNAKSLTAANASVTIRSILGLVGLRESKDG